MRDSFGATVIFMIVFVFIVLFTGYICISINQTRAFNVKNQIVESLERYGSFKDIAFKNSVANTFKNESYRASGNCDRFEGSIAFDRNGEKETDSKNAAFCIIPHQTKAAGGLDAKYFTVITFYQLDLPIIRTVFNLNNSGETQLILGMCDCEL